MTWLEEREVIQQQRIAFLNLHDLIESGAPIDTVQVSVSGFNVSLQGGPALKEWVESRLKHLAGELETAKQRARISGELVEET